MFFLEKILPIFCSFSVLCGAVQLGSYNVDPNSITVSGLSAGGAMAMQFHVAFSNNVSGAGVFAGLPYTCGKGGIADAMQCMTIPDYFADMNSLITHTNTLGSSNRIDPLANLQNHRAYIFHGTKDVTVHPGNGVKVKNLYEHFGATVSTNFGMDANHGFPTDFYGAPCAQSSAATQYINNCNYKGAFQMFNYLYGGNLIEPDNGSTPPGDFVQFDQSDFIQGAPSDISLDTIGFAYIPTGCRDKRTPCRFHIAFHGCVQSRSNAGVGDFYATKTGYLPAAELNNIIVIFPQAVALGMTNPNACFDWWGYLNANFLTKEGAQMIAIYKMMERVITCDDCQSVTEPPTTTSSTVPPAPTTTTAPGTGPTTTRPPGGGDCVPGEISFLPLPGSCDYYIACACGGQLLLNCAPGLYFDPAINQCNFQQLVDCSP